MEAIIAVITVTYNSLNRVYKMISLLFLAIRFVSLIYIFVVEGEVMVSDKELRRCLEVFSIGVGAFEILIVYSQTRMVRNLQSVLI